MKKKVLSLLLTLCLVMTFLPMAAFAEGPDKISITAVDELLQFAKAVEDTLPELTRKLASRSLRRSLAKPKPRSRKN